MLPAGSAKLLSIYVNHGDKWHHEPLHLAVLDRARQAGLRGVTLLQTEGGVGSHHLPHTGMNELTMGQMPVIVQIVDREEAIRAFLPAVREMVAEGLMTLADVEVLAPEAPPLAREVEQRPLQPRPAGSVSLQAPVKELALKLLEGTQRYLYVVDQAGKVVGVVGRRDLLQQVLPPHPSGLALLVDALPGLGSGELHRRIQQAHAFTAEQVMVKPVLAVAPDAPFEDAVRLMSERGFAEVPVLDAGRLLGVLSGRDVLARQLQGGG